MKNPWFESPEDQEILSPRTLQICSGGHAASYLMDTDIIFRGYSGRSMILATQSI